jgi:S-adenosylmethionine hydrolase
LLEVAVNMGRADTELNIDPGCPIEISSI